MHHDPFVSIFVDEHVSYRNKFMVFNVPKSELLLYYFFIIFFQQIVANKQSKEPS